MAAAGDKEVKSVLKRALRGELTEREMNLIGFSEETKRAILRAIEVNPAMEETFFTIAELAYGDGMNAELLHDLRNG